MTEKIFGHIADQPVIEYCLRNDAGMELRFLNYGGTVTQLLVPGRKGEAGDVVLGFRSMEGYLQQTDNYIGSLVGRYANRIAKARFSLDGKVHSLPANNNGHTLHGGIKGFDKMIWEVERLPGKNAALLSLQSQDGEEGFPGNLQLTVTYSLSPDNIFGIHYRATTDAPTPVNLTSHCYFNLSAGEDPGILGHQLQINADRFTPVDDELIPTGKLAAVAGGPMDFTRFKTIGSHIGRTRAGYDHNWVLDKKDRELSLAASLYHPASHRLMELYTTKPGIQFYSGNFLDGSLQSLKANNAALKHGGLCLETQFFPDSPNQPTFPNSILQPGEVYDHTTLHKFSIQHPTTISA